jgi:D-glucuronyl C5-epimerase C-terminus
MSLAIRLRKLKLFLNPGQLAPLDIHPYPWRDPHPFYYIVYPFDDPDGHGGYTRDNAFDEAGVPYTPRGEGRWYDAMVVARYAMRMLAIAHVHGRPEAAQRARRQLAPLLASGAVNGAWWRGPTANAMHSERASGIFQGVVISSVLRLVEGRPDDATRDVLDRAFERLVAPAADGGTLDHLPEGPLLEEYPAGPPLHVLNGAVYALFGLYDLADTIGHRGAAELAPRIEKTFADAIRRWDTPIGWSKYAVAIADTAPLASVHYHQFHIQCLRVLHARTGHPAFERFANRWEGTLHSAWARVPAALIKSAQVLWLREVRRVPLAEI